MVVVYTIAFAAFLLGPLILDKWIRAPCEVLYTTDFSDVNEKCLMQVNLFLWRIHHASGVSICGMLTLDRPSVLAMTMCQVLKTKSLHAPLFLAIVMQISQQLSGVNIIIFYSTSLFETAGLTNEMAQYASLAVGGIMVVMTLVSVPLMDVAGRRTLHLSGLLGMLIFSIVFTENTQWLQYLTIASALITLVFCGIGPGTIPWMIAAELFRQGPRPGAMSIVVLFNWFSLFTIGFAFLPLQRVLGDLVLIPFTVVLALCLVFLYFKLPETKNKTFDEIAAFFGQPLKFDASTAVLPKEPDTAL